MGLPRGIDPTPLDELTEVLLVCIDFELVVCLIVAWLSGSLRFDTVYLPGYLNYVCVTILISHVYM